MQSTPLMQAAPSYNCTTHRLANRRVHLAGAGECAAVREALVVHPGVVVGRTNIRASCTAAPHNILVHKGARGNNEDASVLRQA